MPGWTRCAAHADAATGIRESRYAEGFDTVSVCFSKGLGAPMGSCLADGASMIQRARRFRHLFGGGFRQAGIMAAGALHALENHRARLPEDHRRARRLAAGLAELPGISADPASVETNIVRFRTPGMNAFRLAEGLLDRGVAVLPAPPDAMRVIPHLGISDEDVEEALGAFAEVLSAVPA